jgi:hypothetical protein
VGETYTQQDAFEIAIQRKRLLLQESPEPDTRLALLLGLKPAPLVILQWGDQAGLNARLACRTSRLVLCFPHLVHGLH